MITKKIQDIIDFNTDGEFDFMDVGQTVGEIGFDLESLLLYEIETDKHGNKSMYIVFKNGIERQITPTEKEFSIIQERFSRDTRLKK